MPMKGRKKNTPMAQPELRPTESVGLPEGKAQDERLTLAEIIERNRPDPWGSGYRTLYLMCALVFLCSTMNGKQPLFVRLLQVGN